MRRLRVSEVPLLHRVMALSVALPCLTIGVASASGQATTPGPRMGAVMVYDAARAHVLLFGGWRPVAQGMEHPNDLWAWDGHVWREVTGGPDALRPPGRDAPHLAYDTARQRVVMFGGRVRATGSEPRLLADVWEWDGARWQEVRDTGLPAVLHAVTTFDPRRRRLQMYGGWTATGPSRTLREWDGTRWTVRDGGGPSSLTPLSVSIGPAGDLVVTGVTPTSDTDPVPPPPPRTWTFSGTGWHEAEASPPFANLQPAANAPDGTVWIYQAWERWITEPIMHVRHPDGRWSRVAAATGPGIRTTAAAAYDPVRRRVVLFGGRTQGELLGDTWEFDGHEWRKR